MLKNSLSLLSFAYRRREGAIVSPQVELYFRETARIDSEPGRVIPMRQSEVAHVGQSTIAAAGRRVHRRLGFPQI